MKLSALLRQIRSTTGWTLWLTLGTIMICMGVLLGVFLPAFQKPLNRTYESGFGYAAIQRKLGRPFPVKVAVAETRRLNRVLLGEGLIASQSVLVPVIPTANITHVLVQEGQHVQAGDVLAELDDSLAKIKVDSAQLAVETAEAELQRVLIGSAYVLAQERPEKDRINLESSRRQLELLREKEGIYQKLFSEGIMSRMDLINIQGQIAEQEKQLKEAEFNLDMSTQGQPQSRQISSNAIREAKHLLTVREMELQQFKIVAPCDGVVASVLVQPGEYNQDTGRPAIVLARDTWFEANFDQSALELLQAGDTGEVFLEAYPGRALSARVDLVIPLVSFNLGGPETNRPVRPKGSGSAEWPATFKARIRLIPEGGNTLITPGLTGFARITSGQTSVAVPQAALLAPTAGTGLVWVMTDGHPQRRLVHYGIRDDGWVAITAGLSAGETVIVEGQHIIEEGDLVKVTGRDES